MFEHNKIVYLSAGDRRAKKLYETYFGGQIAKFKRKRAKKLSTTLLEPSHKKKTLLEPGK